MKSLHEIVKLEEQKRWAKTYGRYLDKNRPNYVGGNYVLRTITSNTAAATATVNFYTVDDWFKK